MSHQRALDLAWMMLVGLTLLGAWIADDAGRGPGVAAIICLTMAIKGRLVIEYFLELGTANRTLRRLMRAYFYVIPIAALATWWLS